MLKRLISSIITITLLSFSFSAMGANIKKAKEFYDKAEKAYDKSEFSKALKLYEKAFDLSQKYEMYFNIAQCHRYLKNYDKAVFFYKRFLAKFPSSVYKEEVVKQIAAMEKALDEQKAKEKVMGRISVITNPEGAEILVDTFSGKPEGVSPVVLYVTPGTHLLVIKKEGSKTQTTKVTVDKGEMKFLELTLVSTSTAVVPKKDPVVIPEKDPKKDPTLITPKKDPVTAPVATPFYKKWWFYTGVGATVLGLGAMGYFGKTALDKQSEYDDKNVTGANQNTLKTLKSDGEDAALYSDIGLGVAVIAAAATVLAIFLTGDSSSSDAGTPAADVPSAKTFTFFPMCTGTFCGVNAMFRF
ncbi:PEGA domain-containing protein [Myxococcota bacterium]|nr:PEGA domain-containing protein [Myxococcota bacterium]MBU1533725.1 PEGA domain-containing protein [Myxococcota bacterium]